MQEKRESPLLLRPLWVASHNVFEGWVATQDTGRGVVGELVDDLIYPFGDASVEVSFGVAVPVVLLFNPHLQANVVNALAKEYHVAVSVS